jgi:chemotaxis protein MotA
MEFDMLAIIGMVVVLSMVFGGYVLSGGKIEVVLHALPYEGMIIAGAAVGSFMIANGTEIIKGCGTKAVSVIKGAKWSSQDYSDLLCLLFELCRLFRQKGAIGIEMHVERPSESQIFERYPKIASTPFAISLICDSFRLITLDVSDPHQLEEIIDKRIRKHHGEALSPSKALQVMSDGLPALGIVAAVLGVIKTMASIDQPPTILGQMIGGALTGTFLGVFLSYAVVGPMASRMKQIEEEDASFYAVVRDVMTAMLHGYAPQVAVEVGRGNIPSKKQPSFYEVEQAIKSTPMPS